MTRKQLKVKGMMCNHCTANVEKGISSVEGVISVSADLATGNVYVEGDFDEQAVKDKIIELGYQVD